jgi:hypothetical protein
MEINKSPKIAPKTSRIEDLFFFGALNSQSKMMMPKREDVGFRR